MKDPKNIKTRKRRDRGKRINEPSSAIHPQPPKNHWTSKFGDQLVDCTVNGDPAMVLLSYSKLSGRLTIKTGVLKFVKDSDKVGTGGFVQDFACGHEWDFAEISNV